MIGAVIGGVWLLLAVVTLLFIRGSHVDDREVPRG